MMRLKTAYRKTLRGAATLVAAVLVSAGSLMAQSEQVVFHSGTTTVQKALDEIKRQTRMGIAYNAGALNTARTVSLGGSMTVAGAMDHILRGSGFTYNIQGRIISIMPEPDKPQPTALPALHNPRTGDRYIPSPVNNGPVSRRRQVTAPDIRIIDSVIVTPAPERTDYEKDYRSFILPLESYQPDRLPSLALKTNLLYGAGTFTPNLAMEIGLGGRTSLEISGSYNFINRAGSLDDNKKLVHSIFRPEFRYWTCERFSGHFFGFHAFYARYNISAHKLPLLDFEKQYRYDGDAFGAGVTYGYHMVLGKRWGLEFNIGAGAARLTYDRFPCELCAENPVRQNKWYFGPTRAGVTLVFIIK